MNYKRIYSEIILNRVNNPLPEDVYGQKHHILPRSLYPQYEKTKTNLVKLTAREHYICHWLLTKIKPNSVEMIHAFWMMSAARKNKYFNSYAYAEAREKFNRINAEYMKKVWSNQDLRKEQSQRKLKLYTDPSARKKISEGLKKLWQDEDYIQMQMNIRTSPEARKKLSENKKAYYANPENRKKVSQQRKKYSAINKKMWINNGEVSKQINIESQIPEGFVKGRVKWSKKNEEE